MSVISESFFSMISDKIFSFRGVAQWGQIKQPEYAQCQNRIALIFALEAVLHKHRENYGTIWNPLEGRKSLDHLLLQKYKWPLKEIRFLNLSDIVLLLQEELSVDKLPEGVREIMKSYAVLTIKQTFSDLREEEWDPELYLTIPK